MDVKKREFTKTPPLEPLTSLAAIVRDFRWRFPRDRRDMVWEYCREAPTLHKAIKRACDSRNAEGKVHNHQSRVWQPNRDALADLLGANALAIRRVLRGVEQRGGDRFDALHDEVDRLKPAGIGPVTVYDVATRIGAYLDVHPTSLYLHAGVRQGLYALLWATDDQWSLGNQRNFSTVKRVERDTLLRWWPSLEPLPTDEIEDFLCTYRDVFADLHGHTKIYQKEEQ